MGMSASVSRGQCVLVINWRISTPTLDGGKHCASHGQHQSKRTAQQKTICHLKVKATWIQQYTGAAAWSEVRSILYQTEYTYKHKDDICLNYSTEFLPLDDSGHSGSCLSRPEFPDKTKHMVSLLYTKCFKLNSEYLQSKTWQTLVNPTVIS